MSDQNDLEQTEDDPEYKELLEYFKSRNIISDTPPPTICPGRAKITANGVVNIERITDLSRFHIKAVLKLPDLKERASYSSHKGLYDLSLQLAENPPPPPSKSQDEKTPSAQNPEHK
ncbi:uncharacterized protein LOC111075706 [Drosophila obscura]|uniref:uncharacterized protein LOC111075706 n=1 Tax=Drosophila obscura TaxID=7282 RepID=UPI000BA14224|nr:uncharacterized protein LOC111075706 [Drosophila obscura]